jgi:TM2 domain-containing membrane protein YozV
MSSGPGEAKTESKRVMCGVLALLLGWLGVHKFVLGMTTPGVIMMLVSLLTCGTVGTVMWVVGIIEGIIYLTKTDEEFHEIYEVGQKAWF